MARLLVIVHLEKISRKEVISYACSSFIFKEIGVLDAQLIDNLIK